MSWSLGASSFPDGGRGGQRGTEGSNAISRGSNGILAAEDVPLQSSEEGASLDFMKSEKSRENILHDVMVSLIYLIRFSLYLFFLTSFLIIIFWIICTKDVVMLIGVTKLPVLFCVIC
jgi:hypothetical protein